VFLTNTRQEVMEVLTGPERRRRWTAEQKLAMVRESLEPGKSVSMVARQHGVNPNQLFHWRKLYQDGSLSAVKAERLPETLAGLHFVVFPVLNPRSWPAETTSVNRTCLRANQGATVTATATVNRSASDLR
jgi:transposase-like protein